MSKASLALKTIPDGALLALEALGENLRIARERRGESLRSWALRLSVSVPTLQRMEGGDPSVGMGTYATALWLCGQHKSLAALADPASDSEAQEIEIVRASSRRRK
jgi:transcriptional regulator with XRE-family HTH domain